MAFLIGTDEAGYGPNLGPLVISASLWQVADDRFETDLYETLGAIVDHDPLAPKLSRITIADSKAVYKPGGGLAGLERTVLTAASMCGAVPADWSSAWHAFAPHSCEALRALPWYVDFDRPLPIDADVDELNELAVLASQAFASSGVRLVAMRSAAVFPPDFNAMVESSGSKGETLSMTTLRLVRQLMDEVDAPQTRTRVVCDKHGGRDKYVAMLQEVFHEWWVTVRHESRSESIYGLGMESPNVEFCFRAKGESFLPAALASMLSKYLRELSMLAFNAYWSRLVPNLRPTAGYPLDARRFRRDIEHARLKQGIPEHVLWRCR